MVALGGGALGSERVREALAPPHRRPPRGGARRGVAAGVRQGPAARARPRPLRPAARRPRRRCTTSVADAVLPPADRDAVRRALPALRALERCAGRHPARVGVGVVGRLPGVPRPRPDRVGLLPPGRRAPVRGHRRERGARPALRGRRAHRRDGRRGAQVDPRRGVRAARARRGRRRARATSWWPWAAAWWATSPASARRSTSAGCGTCRCPPRSWPRSTPRTAGRPAWTCRRARTTRARSTSRRR